MKCKVMAFCAAVLSSAAVFAADWFDAGIENLVDWPADGSDKIVEGQGTWTGTENATLEAAKLKIESMTSDSSLVFEPAVRKTPEAAPLTYSLLMRFTAREGLPPIPSDARCGASVYIGANDTTNYCGLAKNPDGEGSVWVTLQGAVPTVDDDIELVISIKKEQGHSYVQYKVGGTALTSGQDEWLEICDTAEMIGSVSFVGVGDVSSLSAETDSSAPAVMKTLTIPGLDHVEVASVKVAGVAVEPDGEGAYSVEQGSVVTVAFAPEAGWAINVQSMTFVVNDDMTLPATGRPVAVNVAAVITINEVMAKNGVTLRTKRGFEGLDWVELYNSGDDDVDLTGWYMGNDPTKKTSKWPAIEGSCIVPAKGYKIVWFDGDELNSNWAPEEAHVAANISTDAGKHTLFLASAADSDYIVQQITMPGGVKDVSWGRGHLSRTLVSSTSPAEYKVGSGDWTAVDGPVGMSAAASGFTVVSHKINRSIAHMDDVDNCLLDPSSWSATYTNTAQVIAYVGNAATCDFASELYSGFPGATGDNIIYVVTGTVMIPESGDWSFSVGSDDGFSAKLTRLGRSYSWESRGSRGYGQSTATFNLAAGAYEVEVRYFQAGGGLAFDFSAAKGRYGFDKNRFQLVGMGDVVHAGALGSQVAADVSAEMVGVSSTLDWRTTFTLDEAPTAADGFRLLVRYADGFTARLNGNVVATVAASGARSAADALKPQTFAVDPAYAVQGVNTLEITGVNDAVGDTEFYLSAELVHDMAEDMFVYFTEPTPGAANGGNGRTGFTPKVAFSVPHGWKDEAFDLELSCPDNATAVIYYTLDGTSPKIGADSTFRYSAPLHVAGTTVVRAAVPDVDSILQVDSSATYLFYDDVVAQGSSAPAGFPANEAVNSQKMLYGLATAVTQGDADTRARLRRGFTENTRTVSLVIDPKSLFDGAIGIYVNATGNGRGWERQTMVEQINPMDSTDEFSVAAGLRIRGAFSRGSGCPKHSFRLFFRSEYGMGTLSHPLFGDEGAKEFEKIDFRTSQNYAWANNSDGDTFIHECFSRDSERDMGTTYNRSRYYNLFINGVYWGLYQTEERVDENYAESYNGGAAENYDVVRTSQPGYNTGVVEGETAAWTELWRITTQEGYGAGHESNYYKVLGRNPDGTRNTEYPILVNVTNLIEHTLSAHYAEDSDSPINSGGMANNLNAFRNRVDGNGKQDGFMWNRHDAEHSLGFGGWYGQVNSLIYGTPEHLNTGSDLRALGNFNPNLLSYELTANAEYRRVFGDLVYKHMVKAGGALTAPVAEARYRARMAEIDDAIVCESARWGYQYGTQRTRQTWLNSCNDRITFIQNRLPYLIAEYKRRGWYPSVDVPTATNGSGSPVADGDTIAADDAIVLSGPGTVYYTLDGSDPCAADASVAQGAVAYSAGIPVPPEGAVITMRAFSNSEWSALDTLTVRGAMPQADVKDGLRLAAALTSASKDSGGDAADFLVVTNITAGEITLDGVRIVAWNAKKNNESSPSLTYTFPADSSLLPGASLKIEASSFAAGDKLTNSQVGLRIYASDNTLIQDVYLDADWWSGACDGTDDFFVAKTFGAEAKTQADWKPSVSWVEKSLRFFELDGIPANSNGDTGEYFVLTNISETVALDLTGVTINIGKADDMAVDESTSKCIVTLGEMTLAAGASIRFDQATYWPGSKQKITNGPLVMKIYDAEGACAQVSSLDQNLFANYKAKKDAASGPVLRATAFGRETTSADWAEYEPQGWTDWPDDPDNEITADTTPADLRITEGAFATATTEELRMLSKWAKANGVAFGGADVLAMAFDAGGNPLTLHATAYLLDCEPTAAEVEDARAAFRFAEIVPGVVPVIEGSVVKGSVTMFGNGIVTVLGAETLESGEWTAPTASSRFYKAILTR